MPDKKPKNMKKLKGRAEDKKAEARDWKHESPAEKQEIHKREQAEKVEKYPDTEDAE